MALEFRIAFINDGRSCEVFRFRAVVNHDRSSGSERWMPNICRLGYPNLMRYQALSILTRR